MQVFADAARAQLVSITSNSMVVSSGARFPLANRGTAADLPSNTWFKLVLAYGEQYEVCYVRTHTGNGTFNNVLRGQDGTAVTAWPVDQQQTTAFIAPIASDMTEMLNRITDAVNNALGKNETAQSATKLATARNIAISGGVTGASTAFDGTSNITINVTDLDVSKATAGALPVARGGTGATRATGTGNNVLSNSPALTGTPTAPTATDGTSTTQLATTAFVQGAVGGFLAKATTGGTTTLTTAEASNPIIKVSGALTSNVILEIPVASKRNYSIENATTGAFTLTVKHVGLTPSVLVAQGKRNIVMTNGVGAYDAINDFESITLTGVPTTTTAAVNTNTTQVASTAFVLGQAATAAPAALGTAAVGNSTRFARENHVHAMPTLDALTNVTITSNANGEILRWNGTAWVNNTLAEAGVAPVASPALTGTPTAPTAAANTNTTQVATTAFVLGQAATATPQALGTAAVGNATRFARENHVHAMPTLDALANTTITSNTTGELLRWNGSAWVNATLAEAGIAPLASPALTGTPTAPTAVAGTNTTQVATTAFVQSAVSSTSVPFASAAENAAGTVSDKAVDPLGIREAFNATGAAPVFACRAWLNFNGTGTVAIRASGNVSSITDNGTGDYTVNFTTPMQDSNFSAMGTVSHSTFAASVVQGLGADSTDKTTSSWRFRTGYANPAGNNWLTADYSTIHIAIFR